MIVFLDYDGTCVGTLDWHVPEGGPRRTIHVDDGLRCEGDFEFEGQQDDEYIYRRLT